MSQGARFKEAGLAVAGVLLAVLALTPREWSERVAGWRDQLGVYGLAGLGIVVGVLVGYWLARRRDVEAIAPTSVSIISNAEYEQRVRDLVTAQTYTLVKIFGYTGETVLNDLFRFDDRYRANLEIRFLHRSWAVEKADEESHNRAYPYLRAWAKASTIQSLGLAKWNHPLRRQFRYYEHQPIIKGMVLSQPRTDEREAFFSFFHWVERPEEGGSAFKGTGMPFIHVVKSDEAGEALIDLLESQFDYEWAHGVPARALPVIPPER